MKLLLIGTGASAMGALAALKDSKMKFEIEILINNAGIYLNEKFSQTSDEIFKKIIDEYDED